MSGKDRLAVFPSRNNQVILKNRNASALKGLNMLKRKRDALDMKLREINAELQKSSSELNDLMREAFITVAKANYLCTDFKPATVMDVDSADVFLTIRYTKVVGVMCPNFVINFRSPSCYPLTGLAHGGLQVEQIRIQFRKVLSFLSSMASVRYAVKVLRESVRQNNTRINGLEFVVIPRIQNTINYILVEMDEYEREDFFRLKRSQASQRKAKERFAELVREKNNQLMVPLPESVEQPFDESEFNQDRKGSVESNEGESPRKKRVTLQLDDAEEDSKEAQQQDGGETRQPEPDDENVREPPPDENPPQNPPEN